MRGRLVQILPVQSGTSKAGNAWCKQEFVIETIDDQFPRKVVFTLFGDGKVAMLSGLNPNDDIDVSFNLESREFNGKWYTNANAWRVAPASQGNMGGGSSSMGGYGEIPPPSSAPSNDYMPTGGNNDSVNDLPF